MALQSRIVKKNRPDVYMTNGVDFIELHIWQGAVYRDAIQVNCMVRGPGAGVILSQHADNWTIGHIFLTSWEAMGGEALTLHVFDRAYQFVTGGIRLIDEEGSTIRIGVGVSTSHIGKAIATLLGRGNLTPLRTEAEAAQDGGVL